MKTIKVEVIDNENGKALAAPRMLEDETLETAMPMVDAAYGTIATPLTGWVVVSKPHCKMRKREWNFGAQYGLHCPVTTVVTEL